MNFEYIIVQAGGKGTRLEHLTKNKPKALVPINNRPMLFHLFNKYPQKKFIIIGDYKCDVLEKYLAAFAEVDYTVVNANGKAGTCGGLASALSFIPDNKSFMLIWSDLVLPEEFKLDDIAEDNYVCLSGSFECRWKFENKLFAEERSKEYGVAGMFLFKDKELIKNVPDSGEFVRWLSSQDIDFSTVTLSKVCEYGLLKDYNALPVMKCRPFNFIKDNGDTITKMPITKQGESLAKRESAWYEFTLSHDFPNLPKIHNLMPLEMEKITGKNIYEYTDISLDDKKKILYSLVKCLKDLHNIGSVPTDKASYDDAYIDKTLCRLEKVRKLVPFANDETVNVNGRVCRNFFYHIDEVKKLFDEYQPSEFVFLHGDCTFSNIMLRENMEPVLIDPRGYFGFTQYYGDVAYDWAKLYYSFVGNYDQFNLKKFRLSINENVVDLSITSSGWEDLEDYFFELIGNDVTVKQIKLIHSIIWLSLTTYAWEDYDSICGAFYNGLYYLEEIL